MVPIVGNLLCNAVITLVGLSVSPIAAAACLAFLILIHKAEYVINAKVVGRRTHIGVWELLCVMFVAEAVFGPSPGQTVAGVFLGSGLAAVGFAVAALGDGVGTPNLTRLRVESVWEKLVKACVIVRHGNPFAWK
jgi:predicted PurR-regulated permease PerM